MYKKIGSKWTIIATELEHKYLIKLILDPKIV